MIKHVLIDIDNTLLDFDKCAKTAVKEIMRQFSLPVTDKDLEDFIKISDSLWEQIEKGTITRPEMYKKRSSTFLNNLGYTADADLMERLFREHIKVSKETVDGAEDLLAYLHTKYTISAISNASHDQQSKRLELANLFRYVDNCFTSNQIGSEKPNAKFFDYCFNALDNPKKEEVILIGDSITADVIGGKNYGIKTCYFEFKSPKKTYNVTPDYKVYSLAEIKSIL